MDTTPAGTGRIGGLSPDAFTSLFQAISGLRNQRALVAMLSCFVTGIVLAALLGAGLAMLGSFGALPGALVSMIVIWTGINAAGVLLMDQARCVPPRGIADAPGCCLSFSVGMCVFGGRGMGMMPSVSMSAWILGGGGGGRGGLLGAMQGFGAGGGHAIAGSIGSGVLCAIAATLVSQVYLLGQNIVYLRLSDGLDASATQQALQQKIDEARKRAADMGQKAREAAERAREQSRPNAAPPVAPAGPLDSTLPAAHMAPPALSCPACQAKVTAEDMFCESCGHRLK